MGAGRAQQCGGGGSRQQEAAVRRSCSPLLLAHQHGVDVAQQAGHHQAADQGQGHQVSSVMQDY